MRTAVLLGNGDIFHLAPAPQGRRVMLAPFSTRKPGRARESRGNLQSPRPGEPTAGRVSVCPKPVCPASVQLQLGGCWWVRTVASPGGGQPAPAHGLPPGQTWEVSGGGFSLREPSAASLDPDRATPSALAAPVRPAGGSLDCVVPQQGLWAARQCLSVDGRGKLCRSGQDVIHPESTRSRQGWALADAV